MLVPFPLENTNNKVITSFMDQQLVPILSQSQFNLPTLFTAKGREEFGEKYGPIVVGSIALSDVVLLLSIGIISEAILDDSLESYLLYFVIMAVGPLIAFASAVTFPTSEDDKRKWRKIKSCLS